ncbi:Alpha/Beta hydrolase protein [Stachybotrys elegans]|uniref:Alpha/Beta hydrolase protein n=1 Tax=Stachybotrys elegans TaxID=80388 RepID=A0A8K0T063_9HYPO|nr:Alpha/Beta hydrolase protein [Stachybotrys elegans]
MESIPIPPAKLLSSKSHIVPGPLVVTELFFEVPLDYADLSAGHIVLFARRAVKHEVPVCPPDEPPAVKPYMVFLEGGPGFGNREPQDSTLTWPALARGYQVLLLDHRGVGLSTPVSADMLRLIPGGPAAHARYLRLMRQDNTVRDCEAVRKCLTHDWPKPKAKWSIFGQSYGGFVSLSYLSLHPEGLREVFLTGGLAPVGKSPEDVYRATFGRVTQRNKVYYAKYPEDVAAVHQIASHIANKGGSIPLPAGGTLTVARLLTLGLAFGVHGGLDKVHAVILHLKTSLDQFGFLTRASLAPLETATTFDTNIIYAIIHEAIYCDGPGAASNWAAFRVGQDLELFSWLKSPYKPSESTSEPLYFSGEMVFPLHFETYPELMLLKDVAEMLATMDDWPHLYDQAQLRRNQVPVYAASYIDDMYVDFNFASETAGLVKGTKVFATNVMYHNALRVKADEIFQQLFSLRDDVID